MKTIVFDTGPLISLAMNNLLWILEPLEKKFGGEFYITGAVERECIERPLTSKKFKFEALQIMQVIQAGGLTIYKHKELTEKANHLLNLANTIFIAQGNYIKNIQYAEVETIVASKLLGSSVIVMDEFITRAIIEDPMKVKDRMEKKLGVTVSIDKNNLSIFRQEVKETKVIRSLELVAAAYELNFFEKYYIKELPHPRKTLLEGLLWALKLNGCSVTENEINDLLKIETF